MNTKNDVWPDGSGIDKDNPPQVEGKPGNSGFLAPMDKHLESTPGKLPGEVHQVLADQSKDKLWWGGGEPGHRSIFCIYGVDAETTFELGEELFLGDNRLTVWLEGNPAEYNLDFAKGHDIIVVKAGFAPNRWRNLLVHGLDKAGAVRILNLEKEYLDTNFLAKLKRANL